MRRGRRRLSRGDLAEVDGFLAVLLWQEYERTGDARPLETLLAYNIQDVVNLEQMLVLAYNLKIRATRFFAAHAMPPPTAPPTPFKPDAGVVRRLRHSSFW